MCIQYPDDGTWNIYCICGNDAVVVLANKYKLCHGTSTFALPSRLLLLATQPFIAAHSRPRAQWSESHTLCTTPRLAFNACELIFPIWVHVFLENILHSSKLNSILALMGKYFVGKLALPLVFPPTTFGIAINCGLAPPIRPSDRLLASLDEAERQTGPFRTQMTVIDKSNHRKTRFNSALVFAHNNRCRRTARKIDSIAFKFGLTDCK